MRAQNTFVVLLLATVVTSAHAQSSPGVKLEGWGPRVGLADNPDQILGGVQFDLGEIARDLRLRPDVMIGLGDDETVFAAAAAAHYHFRVNANVTPFAGGGVVAGWIRRDRAGADDETDFEIALEISGGVEWELKSGNRFLLELDLVIGDIHNTEILAGWLF